MIANDNVMSEMSWWGQAVTEAWTANHMDQATVHPKLQGDANFSSLDQHTL